MLDYINANQGIIAIIGIIISVLISIIGFFITNKNITNTKIKQEIGEKSNVNQAGNNLNDKSQKIGDNSIGNTQFHVSNDK